MVETENKVEKSESKVERYRPQKDNEGKLMLRSILDIMADLKKEIPYSKIRTRKQGGNDLDYIPWYYAVQFLDAYAPGWSYEVRSITQVGNDCVVSVRVSIPCLEGIVSRDATGIEKINYSGYGDTSSNAESMALRRAASKFGLGLYLYDK